MTSIAIAEHEPITGVVNYGGLGAVPPVGVQGQSPPEDECLFAFTCPNEAANLTNYYVHAAL